MDVISTNQAVQDVAKRTLKRYVNEPDWAHGIADAVVFSVKRPGMGPNEEAERLARAIDTLTGKTGFRGRVKVMLGRFDGDNELALLVKTSGPYERDLVAAMALHEYEQDCALVLGPPTAGKREAVLIHTPAGKDVRAALWEHVGLLRPVSAEEAAGLDGYTMDPATGNCYAIPEPAEEAA